MWWDILKGLKVCIYLRKSRTDIEEEVKAAAKGEKYDTLERHRAELLKFARDNDLIIVDIFEEVISGNSIEKSKRISYSKGNNGCISYKFFFPAGFARDILFIYPCAAHKTPLVVISPKPYLPYIFKFLVKIDLHWREMAVIVVYGQILYR